MMKVRCPLCLGTRVARIVVGRSKQTVDCSLCDATGFVSLMEYIVFDKVRQLKRIRDRVLSWIE